MPPFYAASPQKGRPRKRKTNNPLHSQPPELCGNSGNGGGVHQPDPSAVLTMGKHLEKEGEHASYHMHTQNINNNVLDTNTRR